VDRAQDDLEDAILLDAAVADEREVPERVRARTLFAPPRQRFQPVDRRGVLDQVSAGDIDFNPRDTNGHVVRVDRGREQLAQSTLDRDAAAPVRHARRDLLVRAAIVIDGALQQQFGLLLRRHPIEHLDFVFGEDVRRSGRGRLLQAGDFTVGCSQTSL
jgi:hypothetical protein